MRLSKLIESYKDGLLSKKEYAVAAFLEYEELLDYRSLLSHSAASEIIINKEDVLFVFLMEDNNCNIYRLVMKLWEKDTAQVPATVMSFGSYEKDELNMISKVLKCLPDDSIVFDIGANFGWYSLNIKMQYPGMKVYAFEPISDTCNKMEYNCKLNDLDIAVFNFGLYKETTNIDFYYDTIASGASSMRDLRELDTTIKTKCHMKKLDEFVKQNDIQRIDFIKCDVEGSELFVYQGGFESIKHYKPIVFSEMLRKWSAKFGYHPNDIIHFFSDIGYGCFVLDGTKGIKELRVVTNETEETNYFFLDQVKHKRIIEELVR